MGIRLYQEPRLENPVMVASWPGIGNIGIIAVDTLREMLGAEEFGEIEPWHFFYPKRVLIRKGVLECLEFPGSKFYFRAMERGDLILFVGEEQNTPVVELSLNLMEDLRKRYRAEIEQAYSRIRAEVERNPQLRVKQVQQGERT
ncbi:unnamed protein product, partial [marine sediment metagenome]